MIDISVRHQLRAHIVSLTGVADAELLAMLLDTVRQLAIEDGPVVVDLSEVTLVAPDALRSTLVGLATVPTLRVVSRRDTARVILLRCGLAPGMLFANVDDALGAVAPAGSTAIDS
jgi:hypothetical protein